jgi:hypothetical protein
MLENRKPVSEKFLADLELRLRTLHERPVLIDAGLVTDDGHFVKGTRTEEPMSETAIQRIVESYRDR